MPASGLCARGTSRSLFTDSNIIVYLFISSANTNLECEWHSLSQAKNLTLLSNDLVNQGWQFTIQL